MFSVYTVCFFGHRQIDDFRLVEQKVETLIIKLLNEHEYVEFLVGRDGEFDQLVTSAILRCSKRMDTANCSVTWVMPYMKADYVNNSESYDNYYDSVEVCEQSANAHPKAAIQIRNRAIVDRSDLCVFCVTHKRGGAYQTLRYAKKSNVNIVNLFE
ncbi:MAG: hypothetical protein MR352_06420 [Ruminococcus sp.]|nr:hypothetical protein [Ruminococcus sp.]MCI5617688.1 hypothetical protein [Ruminococcus sp.]